MDVTENIEQQQIKPRNSFVAFLLSILTPGLGQIYNGQFKKGIILFLLLLFIPIIFGIFRFATFFYGIVSLFLIQTLLSIFIVIDSIIQSRRRKRYVRKRYNKWYYHFFIAFIMFVIIWFYDIRTVIGVQTFTIPSVSQAPTIQKGDWLIADMQAYNNESLDYGHIVVFNQPNGQIWTFRVVGLPNDKIKIVNNSVVINGKNVKSTFIEEIIFEGHSVLVFEEEFSNNHKHKVFKNKEAFDITKTNIDEIIVPSNNYYLLGDNRDNAMDSRFIGTVQKNDILGQIKYSYWGKSKDRININFKRK